MLPRKPSDDLQSNEHKSADLKTTDKNKSRDVAAKWRQEMSAPKLNENITSTYFSIDDVLKLEKEIKPAANQEELEQILKELEMYPVENELKFGFVDEDFVDENKEQEKIQPQEIQSQKIIKQKIKDHGKDKEKNKSKDKGKERDRGNGKENDDNKVKPTYLSDNLELAVSKSQKEIKAQLLESKIEILTPQNKINENKIINNSSISLEEVITSSHFSIDDVKKLHKDTDLKLVEMRNEIIKHQEKFIKEILFKLAFEMRSLLNGLQRDNESFEMHLKIQEFNNAVEDYKKINPCNLNPYVLHYLFDTNLNVLEKVIYPAMGDVDFDKFTRIVNRMVENNRKQAILLKNKMDDLKIQELMRKKLIETTQKISKRVEKFQSENNKKQIYLELYSLIKEFNKKWEIYKTHKGSLNILKMFPVGKDLEDLENFDNLKDLESYKDLNNFLEILKAKESEQGKMLEKQLTNGLEKYKLAISLGCDANDVAFKIPEEEEKKITRRESFSKIIRKGSKRFSLPPTSPRNDEAAQTSDAYVLRSLFYSSAPSSSATTTTTTTTSTMTAAESTTTTAANTHKSSSATIVSINSVSSPNLHKRRSSIPKIPLSEMKRERSASTSSPKRNRDHKKSHPHREEHVFTASNSATSDSDSYVHVQRSPRCAPRARAGSATPPSPRESMFSHYSPVPRSRRLSSSLVSSSSRHKKPTETPPIEEHASEMDIPLSRFSRK